MPDESTAAPILDPAALDRIRQAWVAADDAVDRLVDLGPGERVFRAILDGRRYPSTYEWAAIAEALRVNVDWLVWGDDEAGLRKRLEIAEGAHGEMAALMEDLRRENRELRGRLVGGDFPAARVTRFEVSLPPEDDINHPFYTVAVEDRGNDRWAVVRHRQCLGTGGEWSWESIPSEREDEWLTAHRFDLDTALRLAVEAAPGVTVNGVTAAEALRRREAA